MTDSRELLIHMARVTIAQARHFRQREDRLGWSHRYSQWLLNWAGVHRRRAMNFAPPVPAQRELFA